MTILWWLTKLRIHSECLSTRSKELCSCRYMGGGRGINQWYDHHQHGKYIVSWADDCLDWIVSRTHWPSAPYYRRTGEHWVRINWYIYLFGNLPCYQVSPVNKVCDLPKSKECWPHQMSTYISESCHWYDQHWPADRRRLDPKPLYSVQWVSDQVVIHICDCVCPNLPTPHRGWGTSKYCLS